jgi:hypothetical protein
MNSQQGFEQLIAHDKQRTTEPFLVSLGLPKDKEDEIIRTYAVGLLIKEIRPSQVVKILSERLGTDRQRIWDARLECPHCQKRWWWNAYDLQLHMHRKHRKILIQ